MNFNLTKKPAVFGFIAGIVLLGLYFLILSLVNSLSHAISQFRQMWYWILILVTGFGVQIGLYTFIREKLKTVPVKVLATSGGISTGSMIICCLHHLVDVLPIIGLAAISLFLIKYQILFIIIGILSNIIGIILMLEIIQKNNLAGDFLKKILVYDMARVKKIAIGLFLLLLPVIFFTINGKSPSSTISTSGQSQGNFQEKINLPSRTDSRDGISFKVTPKDFSFDNPVKFEIAIDTHSGSLGFDLTKIAILEDDRGNRYQASDWQGPGPGGHHLAGVLIFPKLSQQSKNLKLIIEDSFSPRIFEWEIKSS